MEPSPADQPRTLKPLPVGADGSVCGMVGYELVSSDGKHLGLVVGIVGECLLIERGRLRKTLHPLPLEFAHPDDGKGQVSVTVPRRVLEQSPSVRQPAELDTIAVEAYYGLLGDDAPAHLPPPARSSLKRKSIGVSSQRTPRLLASWLARRRPVLAAELDVRIERPAREVFETVADLEGQLPSWAWGVRDVCKLTSGPTRVGTTFRVAAEILGKTIESPYRVTLFEPHARFGARAAAGPLHLEEVYTFRSEGRNTRLTLAEQAELSGILTLTEPVLGLLLRRLFTGDLGRLKQLVESR